MAARTLAMLVLIAGVSSLLTGCLVSRRITDVISHENANSYKVQTEDGYYAGLSGWVEWSVWSCYQTSDRFHCKKVEHAQNMAGFKPGADALPPAPPRAASSPAAPPPANPSQPAAPPPADARPPETPPQEGPR